MNMLMNISSRIAGLVALAALLISLILSGCAPDRRWQALPDAASPAESPFIQMEPRASEPRAPNPSPPPPESEIQASDPDKLLLRLQHLAQPPAPGPQAPSPVLRSEPLDQQPPVPLQLAFDNADLHEVLDATLYEMFGLNYMIDPSIRAKVTFHVAGEFNAGEFINLLNQVLQLSNLAIVRGPGNILKIVNRSISPAVGDVHRRPPEAETPAGDVTRLLRLTYLSAPLAAGSITPFLSRGAVVLQDTINNALIITDTWPNIEKAAAILGALDIPFFKDLSWQVFPIQHVDAADVATELEALFKSGTLFNRPGIAAGSFEIFPIRTLNAILVVSRWPEILSMLADWIPVFDQSDESGTDVFVYFVENGSAVELADILKQIYSSSSSTATRAPRDTIVQPIERPGGDSPAPRQTSSGSAMDPVEIIADETNNALVFKATPRDYRSIQNVLKQLDIIPRQVLINVVIAEVTLSSKLEYGVEWFLTQNANLFSGGSSTVQGALDGQRRRIIDTPLGSASATGFTFSIYDPTHFLRGLVSLMDSDSDVTILASPNILAVDNKEAMFEVLNEFPTRTGEQTTDTAVRTNITYQYRKTGTILKLTPQISSSGLVKIELEQEVSQVGEEVPLLNNYNFLTRRVNTSLVAEDGQTIIIAGIMSSTNQQSQAGIPFLRKIPVLGYLFGGTTNEVQKTELVLMLTPHVINTRSEADRITREFTRNIRAIHKHMDFLEN